MKSAYDIREKRDAKRRGSVDDNKSYDELVAELDYAIENGLSRASGYTYFKVTPGFTYYKPAKYLLGRPIRVWRTPEWQKFYDNLIKNGYRVYIQNIEDPSYTSIRVSWL